MPEAIRRYERCRACRGRDERCATCGGDGYVPIGASGAPTTRADADDLVRRLRAWGARWPHEEATAALMGEAAGALERLRADLERLKATIGDYRRGRSRED